MIDLRSATFDYEPYPIGLIKPVFDEGTYQSAWSPPIRGVELFKHKPALGNKYSLSEVNHRAQYERFIAGTPDWKRFHAYVKGKDFVAARCSSSWAAPHRPGPAPATRWCRRSRCRAGPARSACCCVAPS